MPPEMLYERTATGCSAVRGGTVDRKFRNANVEELVEAGCEHGLSTTLRSENSDSSCRAGMMVGIAGSLFPNLKSRGPAKEGEV